MKLTDIDFRIDTLEQRIWRVEKIAWYVAGLISLKAGIDIVPIVSAFLR